MIYDIFISHASEDKEDVALPLAKHLNALGLRVWIDHAELSVGDSLRRKIDSGLSQSRYGVVILSPAFFSKEWPNKELDALVAREDGKGKVILPVWHNVGAGEILKFSPLLADKLSVSTQRGIAYTAAKIKDAVNNSEDNSELSRPNLGPTEEEILQRLGHQMLTAKSSLELRRTLYVLEEYMARYPHSPEARILKHRIEEGMRIAERMERPRHEVMACVEPSPMVIESAPSIVLIILLLLLAIAGIGAVLFY
jgi:TIR domain